MNCLTKKNLLQKIIIVMLITMILIFSILPNYSVVYGARESDPDQGGLIGTLFKEILNLIVQLGDVIMGALNHFMLGAEGYGSAMLQVDNPNLEDSESWLYVPDDADTDVSYSEGEISTATIFSFITGDKYEIPNMLYSPENIFANNIAALDVNFLRPNTYESISDRTAAQESAESAASGTIRTTIATWYKSFRNIALVGLLSVLVYLGIRILISSTSVDKAKYKESLYDWLVALCLVFVIHFIMSGILMITDKITDLFNQTIDDGITITASAGTTDEVKFRTNLIGYARFNAQSSTVSNTATYSIIYLILVIYTCVFTFIYFKRFLYMAFFTMIAPLVALTYPIDRAGDGKAQAFNMWFKEYTMNAILQPVHLILYAALVSSAMDLVEQNMIYALVAIGFLIPAEKFVKKMFGFDKAETTSNFGSFAGGALAMTGVKQVASLLGKGKSKSGGNSSGGNDGTSGNGSSRIRTQDRGLLSSFGDNNGDDSNVNNNNPSNNTANNEYVENENENSPDKQRMLDDKAEWERIANDPKTSDLDRQEALENIGYINDDMKSKGYLDEQQNNMPENQEKDYQSNQQLIQNQNALQRKPGWMRKRVIRGMKKGAKYRI